MSASVPSRRALVPVVLAGLALVGCKNDVEYGARDYAPIETDHGQWLSADAGPDGRLVVTYFDRTRGAIGFAKGSPRVEGEGVYWEYEKVDGYPDSNGLNPGNRGMWTSMKVADDGRVWASYYDVDNGALKVAVRDGGTWTPEVADPGDGLGPDVGQWSSLALDANGNPVVAHFDKGEGALRIAHRGADTWTREEAYAGSDNGDIDAAAGMMARLKIADGVEYVVFHDGAAGTLDLVEGTAGSYTHSVIDSTGVTGQWPSIWIDSGTLYVAYQRVDTQDLMLATRTGGAWSTETVDDGDYIGADTEVFVRDGQVNILYFDGHENDMKLAKKTASGWETSTVAGDGVAVGYHNEVVNSGDRWWAASYDYTNRALFVIEL